MRIPAFTAALIATTSLAGALVTGPASHAREYNQHPHLPAHSQATINRIQADMAFRASEAGGGFYGTFESDCNELNVGTATDANRPDQQIIVADQIINVGGHCRMIRHTGGFDASQQIGLQPPAAPQNTSGVSPYYE